MNCTNISAINKILKEFYLEGDHAKVAALIAGKVSVLIQVHTETSGTRTIKNLKLLLYAGESTADTSIVCSVQVEKDPAADADVLSMMPYVYNAPTETQAKFAGIRGYAVIDFSALGDSTPFEALGKIINLTPEVAQLSMWPTICGWMQNGAIYCSDSEGDNNWPGTEKYPVKTIKRAFTKHRNIRLKCGDTFYTNLVLQNNVVESYGAGNPPVICGLSWPTSTKWVRQSKVEDNHIWILSLSEKSVETFKGALKNLASNVSAKDIGCVYDMGSDRMVYCYRCQDKEGGTHEPLTRDYDLWQPADSSSLYLYLSEDPNNLQLALTAGLNGVEMRDSVLRGIHVKGWGRHGIAATSGSLIENCIIEVIGGSRLARYAYGNGIEVWLREATYSTGANGILLCRTTPEERDIRVNNCIVRNCYDAGLTVQGHYNHCNKFPYGINILFENCLTKYCGYGMEVFCSHPNVNEKDWVEDPMLADCMFRRCMFHNNGFSTGFRYQEDTETPRTNNTNGQIRLWRDSEVKDPEGKTPKPYKIGCCVESCVFDNGNYLMQVAGEIAKLTKICYLTMRDNIVKIYPGQALITTTPFTDKSNENIPMADRIKAHKMKFDGKTVSAIKQDVEKYRNWSGDTTSTIIYMRRDASGYTTPLIMEPPAL